MSDAARELEDTSKQLRTALDDKIALQEKINEMVVYSLVYIITNRTASFSA
jgi:hypothetical protein